MMQITLFVVMILGFVTILTVTVLAILGRIIVSAPIKMALVSGVVVALATAVYQAFDEIDFNSLTAQDFIASLPEDIQDQEQSSEYARDAILELARTNQQYDDDLAASKQTVEQQNEELTECTSKLGDLQSVD
ncbi:MAG: hypothetical protein OXG44_04000, partial [Gammaproteobacteria bacterium]|nr:hypothetical protein [Gammaproteobacteria bacterium]